MVFLATMKNPSRICWQPLKYCTWFSGQPCQDHAGTPDTSRNVNKYVFKRFLPVEVKTSFVHGVLGNHENPEFLASIETQYIVVSATRAR